MLRLLQLLLLLSCLTAQANDFVFMPIGGQSLGLGVNGTPIVTTVAPWPGSALMWTNGIHYGAEGVVVATNKLNEWTDAVASVDATRGESPVLSIAAELLGLEDDGVGITNSILVAEYADGGEPLTDLQPGTTPFTNLVLMARRAQQIAAEGGSNAVVRWLPFVHGEQDLYLGTSSTNYYTNFASLISHTIYHLTNVTGQADTPRFYLNQAANASSANASQSDISQTQLDLHRNGLATLVGTTYHLTRSDTVHLEANGYRVLGELFARAIDVERQGGTWNPVYPTNIVQTATNIILTYTVPEPPLAWDVSLVNTAANYGFAMVGATITATPILAASNVVWIPKSGTATRVRYAWDNGGTSVDGPTAGQRGNLRDSSPDIGRYSGTNLYNWAVIFDLEVPSVEAWNTDEVSRFIQADALALGGQDSWALIPTNSSGLWLGYASRTFGGAGASTVTNYLDRTFPAGDYAIWAEFNGTATIAATAGGDTQTLVASATSATWVRIGLFTAGSEFSTIPMTVTVAGAGTVTIGGLMITTDLDLAQDSGAGTGSATKLFWPYPAIASTGSGARSGNLIYGGHLQFLNGWHWGPVRNETDPGFAARRVSGGLGGPVGERGITLDYAGLDDNGVPNLISGWVDIWDDGSERNQYTLSFYANATSSVPLLWSFTPLAGHTTSTTASNIVARTNTIYADVPVTVTNAGGWHRYSLTLPLQSEPTTAYSIRVRHSQNATVPIQGIQLEKGTTATTWAPMFQGEFQLHSSDTNSLFDPADTAQIRAETFNSGSSFSRTYRVNEGRIGQGVETNYTVSATVASGYATNAWNARLLVNGSIWIDVRADDMPGHVESLMITRVPLHDPDDAPSTSGLLGVHSEFDPQVARVLRRTHATWSRTLSPMDVLRPDRENPSSGVFDWSVPSNRLSTIHPYLLNYVSLGDHDEFPSHMTNASGIIESEWTNYVATALTELGSLVDAVEDLNEPQAVSEITDAASLADVMNWTAAAVGMSGTAAIHVALGGMDVISTYSGWLALLTTPPTAISAHIYAESAYANGDLSVNFNRNRPNWYDWDLYATTNSIPLLVNSESGTAASRQNPWLFPRLSSRVFAVQGRWDNWGAYRQAYLDNELRHIEAWRAIGRNRMWIQYTLGRVYGDPSLLSSSDSGFLADESMGPGVSTYVGLAGLFGLGTGYGQVTNASAPSIEAYLFQNGNGTAGIALWGIDLTNRVVTFTNSAIGVLDQALNVVSTNTAAVNVSRKLVYVLSDTLDTNALKTAFTGASVADSADTAGPKVRILAAPSGTNPDLYATWVAIDDISVASHTTPAGIETRSSWDGSTWSDWGTTTRKSATSLSPGSYALVVQARDEAGNVTASTGPSFTVPGSGSGTINAGTVTVGTININP